MSSHPKGKCFTTTFTGLSNMLFNEVAVENNSCSPVTSFKGRALWDTGATISLITPKVVQALQLKPFKMIPVSTPSGSTLRNVYRVNFQLPNGVLVENINVVDGIPSNCDILIGMDIIGRGDFAVSNHNGKTIFSFRMPSITELDFCKYNYEMPVINNISTGRNSLCPCGSGKKYKKCCGK